jgi:hypothetical protein
MFVFFACLIAVVLAIDECVGDECRVHTCRQETPHRIAVLIPFVERQLAMLEHCVRRWLDRPPFSAEHSHVRDSIDVILYYHRTPAHMPEETRNRIDALFNATMPSTPRFFRRDRVSFMWANLTDEEDAYPAGANHMFYNLFLRNATFEALSRRYKFFALLEPDVRPLRQAWANKVYNETLGSFFWQKGSQFHGRYLPAHFRTHINGNAIYGLGAEAEAFVDMLRKVQASSSIRMGYDNNIMQWLLAEQNYQAWYDHVHMFVYADFIRNLHWTAYDFGEFERKFQNTFLIHNGNATDLGETTVFTTLDH